jgi:hypothetical protein
MTGTVRELWRWPVAGMGGEAMPSVRLDTRGVGGDRVHAVLREGSAEPLRTPVLARWVAGYPFNIGANVDPAAPPLALATAPDGRTFVWNDPWLRCALEKALGQPIRLRRDLHGLQMVERTVLVTWGELDPRALRANLHLDLDGGVGEPGTVLSFDGGVRLRVLGPCKAGGAYARVLSHGRIAAGAAVELVGP